MLAAVEPTLPATLALLVIRAALSQMDVPTRSSYVMAIVTEAERAAAASFTSVLRSLAAAASPPWPVPCSRPHSGRGRYPSAVLKITCDLLLLMQFRHLKSPEER